MVELFSKAVRVGSGDVSAIPVIGTGKTVGFAVNLKLLTVNLYNPCAFCSALVSFTGWAWHPAIIVAMASQAPAISCRNIVKPL